ncbi:hypothetical protein FGO68_gene6154 [Halteria grandinella]|uniref:UDP-N-acetylglucosamine transferase subunit ALG13 n=1 Tax=Halteria grandinella TaxID=5974 RepID=A0A8J8NJ32_HALGN|nr:hypothetical protein FGO68_gene6154 [Halteria grandinella]
MVERIKRCIIAVGSTYFDELIEALDNETFFTALKQAGFNRLLVQLGKGTYKPTTLPSLSSLDLQVEVKDFVVLDVLIYHADLVISHCGAGILLECLRSDHALCIAVVNDSLMGNHQSELADKLEEDGYIGASTPKKVLADVTRVLGEMKAGMKAFKKYPMKKEQVIVDLIDDLLIN